MLNVFAKKSEELHVQLSDGRIVPLKKLVKDYERLLKEEYSKKDEPSKYVITSQLKAGEWFRIDRDVIDENRDEIYRKCIEEGTDGKKLWESFEKSNKIANQNPDQYSHIMEVYIFKHDWRYKTEQEMQDMCEQVGEGMCDEIICDFELQMRICNGESVNDLVQKADKLPHVRVIKLRNGGIGYFGGGADDDDYDPPVYLLRGNFNPDNKNYMNVPYAFRRVLS